MLEKGLEHNDPFYMDEKRVKTARTNRVTFRAAYPTVRLLR